LKRVVISLVLTRVTFKVAIINYIFFATTVGHHIITRV
jgi:hypothetical protein